MTLLGLPEIRFLWISQIAIEMLAEYSPNASKWQSSFGLSVLHAETNLCGRPWGLRFYPQPQMGQRILIRPNTMWRAFFCAIGIVLIIMGIECLLIDSAVLVAGIMDDPPSQLQQQAGGLFGSPPVQTGGDRVFRPSEWFPWSLLASGAIVLLYSISLRRNGP